MLNSMHNKMDAFCKNRKHPFVLFIIQIREYIFYLALFWFILEFEIGLKFNTGLLC